MELQVPFWYADGVASYQIFQFMELRVRRLVVNFLSRFSFQITEEKIQDAVL